TCNGRGPMVRSIPVMRNAPPRKLASHRCAEGLLWRIKLASPRVGGPPQGVKNPPPACPKLQGLARLDELRIVVNQAQFPVLFARNGERNFIGDENRADRGWSHKVCARAASDHAAAAPPSSVMNSRLLIRSPRRRGRAACPAL